VAHRGLRPVRAGQQRPAFLLVPLPYLVAVGSCGLNVLGGVDHARVGLGADVFGLVLSAAEHVGLLIGTISERVGWCHHCHASRIFRRYTGVSPIEYRRNGPPSASREGPGVGIATARADVDNSMLNRCNTRSHRPAVSAATPPHRKPRGSSAVPSSHTIHTSRT